MSTTPADPARSSRTILSLAAVAGFTGVAAGAFGAHAVKDTLTPDRLAVYETAARYHLIHAVALVGAAWIADRRPSRAASTVAAAWILGIVIFSGSLYALALSGMTWLGAITPLGGLAFLTGWAALFFVARR